MSRSYKKNPVYTDGRAGSVKITKKYANKAVRNISNEDIPTHARSFFKRCFCSYDIHDYIYYQTKEKAIEYWENPHRYHTYENLEECLRAWAKYHYRK